MWTQEAEGVFSSLGLAWVVREPGEAGSWAAGRGSGGDLARYLASGGD